MSENTKCYICGSSDTRLHKKVGDFFVLKCNSCGLKWTANASNEIISLYDKEYFKNHSKIGYSDYLKNEKNHRRNARNILKTVSKQKPLDGTSILDIGSSFGFLLDEARKMANCKVTGIEVSKYANDHATKLGLNSLNAELVPGIFPDTSFDMIFLMGTIEHLVSPRDVINIARKILKPGGLFVITTIDTKGLVPLYSIKPPEHLFYFNHSNLSALLEESGFENMKIKPLFVNYFLYDLIYRMGEFLSLKPLRTFSKFVESHLPDFNLFIPTNEMIVIAQRGK